ncbi:MAG: organic solvent tolerance protein OstA [Bacteroidetes bacterium]|nr:organic solvent tolerance protein OstA [Bacteroidota bacterium]
MMKTKESIFICLAVVFLLVLSATMACFAQETGMTRIELVHADVNEFDQSINKEADRLIGNVSFRHENAIMNCDSAYLNKVKNSLVAFGHVKIVQGDTITLTGKRLNYDGNTQLAQVFEDVVMKDRKMTLHTSRLNYDMNKDVASYTDSAHIVDAENTLTSRTGYLFSKSHDLFFKKDMLLVNPRYTMTSDTLRYNTLNSTAFFLGPTFIHSKDNLIYCENGWYNTDNQKSAFHKNAFLKTQTQTLKGDTISYDRNAGIGKGFGHVSVNDSTNKIIISGNYAEHHELTDSSFVTGDAMMVQIFEKDSMFLHGDTLMALTDQPGDTSANRKRNLFAFHHVKLFKNDFQGKCDSLVYNYKDSTIRLFRNPVLWSGPNQLSADSVTIQTGNSQISKMYLVNSAFIVSRADTIQEGPVDSLRFNQVRGKNMTGYFSENKLYRILVEGNGQTIYYAKNKNQKNFGVNRADCSNLVIMVNENKVEKITLLNEPDGTLYPIRELSTKELRLKGFTWKGDLRPATKEDIFK